MPRRLIWPGPMRQSCGMDITNPALDGYLRAHCTAPDEVLIDLAAETVAATGQDAGMQVSHDEGVLLGTLARLVGARNAVEVGVFTGYSSICVARALQPGGRLLACDVSPEWTSVARRYWERAGVTDRIELRLAPAEETLRALPTDPVIDFAFVDADKVGYPVYYEQLVSRLRPGGLIVLDNVLRSGRVIDPAAQDEADLVIRRLNDTITADTRVESVMLPVRDGITLARRHD
jgi:caffeoyl-CoA O-methyltransferase